MKEGGSGKILRWSMLSMGPKTICASIGMSLHLENKGAEPRNCTLGNVAYLRHTHCYGQARVQGK